MNLSTLNPNELVGPSGRNVQSAYFDGTGDYLTVPYTSASFDWWTSDFTIEAWVYAGAWTNWSVFDSSRLVGNMDPTGGSNGWSFGPDTTGKLRFYYYTGTGRTVISSATLINSQWNHIAMTKTASGITLFINGAAETTTAIVGTPQAYTAQPLTIGSWYSTSIIGYVSNLRIIKGTALYTGNFTPPTAPLTSIANTSFLLGFSEYQFIDQSPNNFTITRNGDTTQSTFGPYGNNWSNYFDGTGDYLRIAPGAAFAFGTGDFTVELWVYPTKESAQIGGGIRMIDARNASQTTAWIIGTNLNASAGNAFQLGWFDGSVDFISTGTLTKDGWNHVVYTRSGTTGSLFLNGARVGTRTDSVNYSISPTQSTIGARFDGTLYATTGYISNIRTVKGTAVYDPTKTTLTVPTAPLSSIPNTSLLTCQSNRFLDASPNNFAITRNGNVAVQPYVPFPANWSNYFDGTGDYLQVADNAALEVGSSDFTVECWAYLNALPASNGASVFAQKGGTSASNFEFNFRIFNNAGTIVLQLASSSDGVNVVNLNSSGVSIVAGTWYHFAVTKSGTDATLWINGASAGTSSSIPSTIYSGAGAFYSGANNANANLLNGYISNLRLVKGTAVYTAAFTPPTTPLTAIPNTSLLTCQSSSFTDFSSNNFTITANGDVSARFYGPFAGPVPEPVVDVYTTTGVANTWIKRPGAKAVQMIAIGAGGGGGGGMGSASSVQRNGGAGGGGGANGQIIYTADQLPSTLYIRVGASGTGGASNTSGGAGGNSTIAAADPITSSTSVYCMGGGGGGGEAGAASSSSVGGGGGGTAGAGTTGTGDNAVSGGLPALGAGFSLGGGGAGGGNGAAGTTSYAAEWGGGGGGGVRSDGANRQPGGGSLYGGAGGGVGGFLNSGGGGTDGICGGASGRYTFGTDQASFGGGAAGVGSAGGAGANASTLYAAGSGGGGGGTSGFAGGAGGFPGGGGGGGGASATTGGTGGVGGAGRVILVTFF